MNKDGIEVNTKVFVVLWVLLFSILIYSQVHAVEAIAKGKAEMPEGAGAITLLDMIMAEGSASILKSDDIEEAKAKALEMAKGEAILKAAGLYVNEEIFSKEKNNLLKIFKPKMDTLIDEYKIVSEDRGEDGFYRVKISAKINQDNIKTLLMKNLYDDRAVVITSEKNMGKSLKRHIFEHELIQGVKQNGYSIVDYRTVKNKTVNNLVSAIRQGNTEAVKKIGLYYLTDIVVVGFVETEFRERTKDIFSAHATGQVKIHQIGSKRELLSLTKHKFKGFGSNEENAGLDAIKKISSTMAEEAMKSLPKKPLKKVTLKIKEIGNYASFKKAKDLIAGIPYVKDVQDGVKDFSLEETTLYLKTTKGVDYVAGKISELKKFVVKKVEDSSITLEARKI